MLRISWRVTTASGTFACVHGTWPWASGVIGPSALVGGTTVSVALELAQPAHGNKWNLSAPHGRETEGRGPDAHTHCARGRLMWRRWISDGGASKRLLLIE
eukprot:scaffold1499_cov111-Isochrysis_galbana.AAC.4